MVSLGLIINCQKCYSGKCSCKDTVINEVLLKYCILVPDLKCESYFIHCDQLPLLLTVLGLQVCSTKCAYSLHRGISYPTVSIQFYTSCLFLFFFLEVSSQHGALKEIWYTKYKWYVTMSAVMKMLKGYFGLHFV